MTSAQPALALVASTPTTASQATTTLRAMGVAVGELADALHLSAATLQAHEAPDRLEVRARLSPDALSRLASAPVVRWFALFGEDLCLDLSVDGLDAEAGLVESPPAVTLRSDEQPERVLAAFVSAVNEAEALGAIAEEGGILARLAIGKSRALAAAYAALARGPVMDGSVTAPSVTVYYQASAWRRLLTLAAVPTWEDVGMLRAAAPTVVVLCDAEGVLAGTALSVWGARSACDPASLMPSRSIWRRFVARAEEVCALRQAESMAADDLGALTPAHLRLSAREPGLEAMADALARLRAEVTALYLASAVTGACADGFSLRFAGARPASCVVRGEKMPDIGANSDEGREAWAALARMAAWAYGGVGASAGERLVVARECLARELPAGRNVTLAELGGASGTALEAARANLAILRRGQTERYFQSRQAALDAVAVYAEGVRAAGSALASDVVENVYRTVGLLVAVGIAALLQPASSLLVVRVAAMLYTAYVGFVLVFYLRSRQDRQSLDRAGFERRLGATRELSPSERRVLTLPASEADVYFARYLARARAIYWGLIVAGALLTILLLTPLTGSLPRGSGGTPGTHVTATATPRQ